MIIWNLYNLGVYYVLTYGAFLKKKAEVLICLRSVLLFTGPPQHPLSGNPLGWSEPDHGSISPVTWNPNPFPAVGSPPPFPVAWNPNSGTITVVAVATIIAGAIITRRRVIASVVDRRRPDRRRTDKDPESGMSAKAVMPTPG